MLSGWDVSNGTSFFDMLSYSGMSTESYDSLLDGWAAPPSLSYGASLGAAGVQYSSAGAAGRQSLIDNCGWSISDGGLRP